MPTSAEIYGEFAARRLEMQEVERDLDNKARDARRKRYPGSGLTQAQKDALDADEILARDQKIVINKQMEELAYTTLERLETADDLDEILKELKRVIAGLNKVAGRIASFADIANKVTKIAGGISTLQGKVKDLKI